MHPHCLFVEYLSCCHFQFVENEADEGWTFKTLLHQPLCMTCGPNEGLNIYGDCVCEISQCKDLYSDAIAKILKKIISLRL